jgi:serine/threonine-protein kinase
MQQFRIEETLSESSTTRVYRAFQIALARRVLLKVLRPHLAGDPVVRERFVHEAHACAKLRFEHIVQVYDLTEHENCPAIVMEFIQGSSLKELLSRQQIDRPALARKTSIEMLQALSVAHRHGITHRDIKPGNILITEDGVMKLTDFGLAHVADSTLVTTEGMVVGTPAYMSPEQVRGDRIDARTDLFALGVTVLEVLTGERIFEGETYAECIRKVLAFKPESLDRFAQQVPQEIAVFVKRLLQPKPEMRFASALDALDALHVAVDTPPTFQPAKGSATRRRLVVAGTVAVAIIVIVAVVMFWPTHTGKEPVIQQQALQTPDSSKTVAMKPPQTKPDVKSKPTDKAAKNTKVSEERQAPLRSVPPAQTSNQAFVRFACNPWAKVFVDDQPVGETPISQPVVLPDHSVDQRACR